MSSCMPALHDFHHSCKNVISVDTLLLFRRLIKSLLDGENEFVREMSFFAKHHLSHVETNPKVPLTILSQKEYIFRNIKDIASFHARYSNAKNKPEYTAVDYIPTPAPHSVYSSSDIISDCFC